MPHPPLRVGPYIEHYAVHVVRDGYRNHFRCRSVAFGPGAGRLHNGVVIRDGYWVGTIGDPRGDRVIKLSDRSRAVERYAQEQQRLREAGGQPIADQATPDEETVLGLSAFEEIGAADVTCAIPFRDDAPSLRLIVGTDGIVVRPGAPLARYPLLRRGVGEAVERAALVLPEIAERFGIVGLTLDGYLLGTPRRVGTLRLINATFEGEERPVALTEAEGRELAALLTTLREAGGRLSLVSAR